MIELYIRMLERGLIGPDGIPESYRATVEERLGTGEEIAGGEQTSA